MIEILHQSTGSCLTVQLSGKVTGEEYQQFLDAVESHLQTGDQVNLVMALAEFEFYGDFDSAKKDLKFGFGEYKLIHRVALVGDQKWLGWFTRLIGPFTRTEEKHFPASQFDAAISWACS